MRAEYLHYLLVAVTCKEQKNMVNWDWVVDILQTYFQDGRIPTEYTWYEAVVITKENR